jgi:hypothetical protein
LVAEYTVQEIEFKGSATVGNNSGTGTLSRESNTMSLGAILFF